MLRKGYFTILGSLILVLTLTSCNIIPSQSENIATNEQGKVDNNVTEDVNDTENKYENSAISLPIPPILEDTNPDPTVAEYTLTADYGTTEIIKGISTDTLGYNGNILGPTIRSKNGEKTIKN